MMWSFYLLVRLYEINKSSVMSVTGPEVSDNGVIGRTSGSMYGQQPRGCP